MTKAELMKIHGHHMMQQKQQQQQRYVQQVMVSIHTFILN